MSEPTRIAVKDLLLAAPEEQIQLVRDIPNALRAAKGRVAVHVTLGGARRGKSLLNSLFTSHVAGPNWDCASFATSDDPCRPCTLGAQAMLVQRENDCVLFVDAEGQNLGDERAHDRLFTVLMLIATNVTVVAKGVGDHRLFSDLGTVTVRTRAADSKAELPAVCVLVNQMDCRVPDDPQDILTHLLFERGDDMDAARKDFSANFKGAWAAAVPIYRGEEKGVARDEAIANDCALGAEATTSCGAAIAKWCQRATDSLAFKYESGAVAADLLEAATLRANSSTQIIHDDAQGNLQAAMAAEFMQSGLLSASSYQTSADLTTLLKDGFESLDGMIEAQHAALLEQFVSRSKRFRADICDGARMVLCQRLDDIRARRHGEASALKEKGLLRLTEGAKAQTDAVRRTHETIDSNVRGAQAAAEASASLVAAGVTTKEQLNSVTANYNAVESKSAAVEKILPQVGAKELAQQIQLSLLQHNALGARALVTTLADDNYKSVSGGSGTATSSKTHRAALDARKQLAMGLAAGIAAKAQ